GADLKFGDEHPEYNVTGGAFSRNLPSFGAEQTAAALLFDYQHTYSGNDLFALRPVLGTTVGQLGSLGGLASIGLNDDDTRGGTRDGSDLTEEEAVDRVDGFWNRKLNERLTAELIVGYQLGDGEEEYFAPQLALELTDAIDLGAGPHVHTAGDYAATFGFSFHFGQTGRHEWVHNVDGQGTTLYTPFPKQPLAAFLRESKHPIRSGGTGVIGGDDPGIIGGPNGPAGNPNQPG